MKDPVHVLCATNSAYIMPLSVTLASLVDHFDPERDLVIHIISNDASAQDRENIRQSILLNRPNLDHIEIHWYSYDPSLLARLPLLTYFTLDTYSRLLAQYLLPESIERVVYLDCDLIILEDVSKLYDSAVGPAMLHATQDIATPFVSSKLGVFDYAERGIPPQTRYFNAGIIVINLKRWRKENLTPTIIDYVVGNARQVHAQDQGGMNAFLYNDWTPFDTRWNAGFDVVFADLWESAGRTEAEWRLTRDHPYIIHYSGVKKPWLPGVRGPRYSYFYQYLQKTVYKDSLPHRPYLEDIIGFPLYYRLWKVARMIPGLIKR